MRTLVAIVVGTTADYTSKQSIPTWGSREIHKLITGAAHTQKVVLAPLVIVKCGQTFKNIDIIIYLYNI